MKVRAPEEPIDPLLEDDIEDGQLPQQDDATPPQPDDQDPQTEEVGQGNKNNVLLVFFTCS